MCMSNLWNMLYIQPVLMERLVTTVRRTVSVVIVHVIKRRACVLIRDVMMVGSQVLAIKVHCTCMYIRIMDLYRNYSVSVYR